METWRGFCILNSHPVYGWYFLFKYGSAAECCAPQYGKGCSNIAPHLLNISDTWSSNHHFSISSLWITI